MGEDWNQATSTRRSALRERLSVRRDLPRARVGAGLAVPFANTEAMQLHLEEISRHVAEGAHAALILDRAAWHTTGNLDIPANITLMLLPSRAPN